MLKFTEGSFSSGGRFRGLDRSRRPDDIPPGALFAASNVVLDGEDIVTRPGADGQLASTLGSPLRAFTPFDAGALFVSGGKLYYWVADATSRTEILKGGSSLALTSNSVQVAQAVGVGFLVDGVGSLIRTTSSAASDLTELDRPAAPTGTIYHETLRVLSSLTWAQNFITGATTTPAASGAGDTVAPMSSVTQSDSNFWDAANLTGTPFWLPTRAGAPAFSTNIQDGNKANAVELDSNSGPGDSVQSDPILLNAATTSGYARVAVLSYEAAAEDATSNSMVVDADVIAYSDTGGATAITGSTKTWRSPFLSNSTSTQIQQLVDLRGLSTVPRSIRVGFTQPLSIGSTQGADVNRVALHIPRMELGVVSDADNRLTVRQGTVQVWQGYGNTPSLAGALGGKTDPASSAPGRLLTAGLKLTASLGGNQNWSGVRTLGLELLPAAGVSGLALRLGFKVSSTWYYTDALDIPTASSPETSVWAIGELRDIAASLTAVSDVLVEILSDVLVEGLQEGGDAIIFRLGDLRNVGNLPEGRPVWYKLVEMDEAGDTTNLLDVVYSDGSPSTSLIEGSRASRMGRLVLPARTNSGAEWLALYRFGGSYIPQGSEPAQGRLVALITWAGADFAFGADTDKGAAPRIVAFGNPYISWDKTGSTGAAGSILIDNTPDSWLVGADTYLSGREKAPTAAKAIASWDKRLWLADGANLYASWELSAGATAGVYWTRLQLPVSLDPEAAIKGHWERLALAAGDSIQRMIALTDYLIVLTKQRVYRVSRTGETVPAYSVERLWDADAAGMISPYAACELEGRAWWLTSSGLRVSDGQSVTRVGEELFEIIKASTYASLQVARLSACPASRKLFLCIFGVLYVYHLGRADGSELEVGWTSWPTMDSLLAADVNGIVHLAGETSGQIWKMNGTQDDSGAIAASITTRRYSESIVGQLQPTRLLLHVVADASETLTITVKGDSSALSAEMTQTLTAGEWEWPVDVPHTAEGAQLDVTLATTASAPVRFRGLALDAIQKRRI